MDGEIAMKYLITGAAGFIGSAVSQALVRQGHTISAVDSFSNYYSRDLKISRAKRLKDDFGIDTQRLDLSDEKSVKSLFLNCKPDIVIHLAAQPGVRLPLAQNAIYVKDNLVGFSNIATASAISGVDSFLYASSSSVYGDQREASLSESNHEIRPISFYGATKIANEFLAHSIANTSDTKFRGMRFFTVYGPWGRPDMAYFKIINAAINRGKFELYGDGSKTRDFTYLDDVISSVISLSDELLLRNSRFSDVVNIGGGNPVSINGLINTIQQILNVEIYINRVDNVIGDVSDTMADTRYLDSLIKPKKFVELRDGISETVEWALEKNATKEMKKWIASN